MHVTIEDSTFSNNSKGIYIRRGSHITLKNSLVTENRQEGLDVRARTTSLIENNQIVNNNHSGSEFIIGGSDAMIRNNTLEPVHDLAFVTNFLIFIPKNVMIEE